MPPYRSLRIPSSLRCLIGQEITSPTTLREILTRLGYKVDYATTAQAAAWQGLSDGALHVNAEQWLVTQKPVFEDLKQKGKVTSLGQLGLVGREAWYYPEYVAEKWSRPSRLGSAEEVH